MISQVIYFICSCWCKVWACW